MKDQPIILFDGVCNFCNDAVNFVIKKDKRSAIKFTPIQSVQGQTIVESSMDIRQITLVPSYSLKTEMPIHDLPLRCRCVNLSAVVWSLLYGFIIVPKFIRDGIYNLVAKNRYKWFGRKDQCMIPTPEVRQRFL